MNVLDNEMGESFQQYYSRQASGARSLPTFRGVNVQRGSGLGGILNSAVRMFSPMIAPLKRVGKAALSQGAKTGANILSDVLSGDSLQSSIKRRGVRGGKMFIKKALGQIPLSDNKKQKKGVKRRRRVHFGSGIGRVRTVVRRRRGKRSNNNNKKGKKKKSNRQSAAASRRRGSRRQRRGKTSKRGKRSRRGHSHVGGVKDIFS